MESLNYKIKSWHAWLFKSTYGKEDYELPKSICDYFWLLLLAIIIAIPSYIGHIHNAFSKNKFPAWIFSVVTLFSFLLPFGIYDEQAETFGLFKLHFIGLGFILGIIVALCILGLIAAGFDYLINKYRNKTENVKNPLVEGFNSFKEKYCKKINWK